MFDKNLMVEFSADGRFTGTRTGWLVVALGLGLGGLELLGLETVFRRPPRFWPRTSAPAEKGVEGEDVWQLQDRVEQRGVFFNSASRPCCNHQSREGIGEEGLGFWALKSERG